MQTPKMNRRNFLKLSVLLGLGACASSGGSDPNDNPTSNTETMTTPLGGWETYCSDVPYDTGQAYSSDGSSVSVGGTNKANAVDYSYWNPISGIMFHYLVNDSGGTSMVIAEDPYNRYVPKLSTSSGQFVLLPKTNGSVKNFGNLSVYEDGSLSYYSTSNRFSAHQIVYMGYHSLEELCNYNTPLDANSLVIDFQDNLFNVTSSSAVSSSPANLASALGINSSTKLHAFSANHFFSKDFPFIYLSNLSPDFSGYPMSELYPIQKGNQWTHSGATTTVIGKENLLGNDFACLRSGSISAYYGFALDGYYTSLVGQKDSSNGRYAFLNPIMLSAVNEGLNGTPLTTRVKFLDKNISGMTMTTSFSCNEKKDLVINNVPYGDCFKLQQHDELFQDGVSLGTDYAEYWLHRSTGPVQVHREANGISYGTAYLESVSRITTPNQQVEYWANEISSPKALSLLLPRLISNI
jgi:hypothetical protein